jgi:uncharacterized protein
MSAAGEPIPPRQRLKRFIRRRVIRFGVGYLVICFLMWLLENRLVFHPVPATELWNDPPDAAIQDVDFTSPEGCVTHSWWLPRRPDAPVVLMCPGNAGNLSGRGQTLLKIADQLDSSVLIFDYPGYGKSEGKPNEPNLYIAGEGAVGWLRDEKGVPSERVVLYGESIGGGVATELAKRRRFRALVLVKTFTSLPDVAKRQHPWLPVHWLMSNRFDNRTKIPKVGCPVFVASATADRLVPFSHGETLFALAAGPKRFFRDEGSDHNNPLPSEFWTDLRDFLSSLN